ncbi:hypothetical protein Vadar_006433 [Vaccinium darrowii]|uniref:Uncharacterized protein n=1 Tax=Vaccinium darrowii TaxID=229202 RepID=A0ACB7Y583_9ERIC|nr:hypothetical protein Vadar_006433 [Vaccinium darrowii]
MFDKQEQSKKSKTEAGQASQASKSGRYYKIGSRFQHLKGQSESKQQSGQGQSASRPSMGRGGNSSGRGTSFQCYRCGSPEHDIRDCPGASKGVKCYNCGEMGHISKQCLKPQVLRASSASSATMGRGATPSTSVGRGGGASGSTAPGKVYAMTRQYVQASPEVVTCILAVSGMHARVLIDPGSTHSFVSNVFGVHLNKTCALLDNVLAISTPIGEVVIVEMFYPKCVVCVGGKSLEVDLIPLGMNFLSSHHASLDCVNIKLSLEYQVGQRLSYVVINGVL